MGAEQTGSLPRADSASAQALSPPQRLPGGRLQGTNRERTFCRQERFVSEDVLWEGRFVAGDIL